MTNGTAVRCVIVRVPRSERDQLRNQDCLQKKEGQRPGDCAPA
jgi:hypothetical protein